MITAPLEVGMRVVVVQWRDLKSEFCGMRGEVVEVRDPGALGPLAPDTRVKLDDWPHVISFWVQELMLEDVA